MLIRPAAGNAAAALMQTLSADPIAQVSIAFLFFIHSYSLSIATLFQMGATCPKDCSRTSSILAYATLRFDVRKFTAENKLLF